MDVSKDWMDTPRHEKEYQVGVERFLHFAFSSMGVPQGEEIQCPCAKCCNRLWLKRDDVYDHLICHGFVEGYRRWFNHGESLVAMDIDNDIGGEYNCNDNIDELLRDRFRDTTQVDGQNMGPNDCAKEFYKLVDEASQELYPEYKGFTRLSFTIRLYLLKCLHGWSNASFTSLLELLKEAIPYLNIPASFDKTKNMVKNLGLDYQKIDACRNDCMLYRNGYENDSSYHVCGTFCYIEHHVEEDDVTSSKKPRKARTPKKKRKVQPTALVQECEHNGNGTMFEVEKNSKTRNQRTAEPDTMEQNDINSDDDGEDTSEMSATSNQRGMSLDMYSKVHEINLEDEENELDDDANDAGSGGQASNEGTIKKKTRGKTMCKRLHATNFNDRWEVEFFQGQPIGPTEEVVSDLNQLLGTTVRNPRFVTLLYTSWNGVPKKLKEDMWEYVNQKFVLPISSKPWVMRALCCAWKKYKGEIKKEHFLKYNTKKEMIKNRPLEIPEVQFRKLIRYWSLPAIKAISAKNTKNKSKQTCPHRMGSTNFGIVRKQLRDSKENSEEPSRAEVFIATRTNKKGKEIDAKTQTTIAELRNRLEAGENDEDAFVGVLGKDQPGRVRCYGASITRSSLKKDEEIRHIKVEYNAYVSSLEKKMDGVCGLLKVLVHQINPEMSDKEVAALMQAAQNSPLDTSSSRAKNTPCSSESTHIPHKDDGSGQNNFVRNG